MRRDAWDGDTAVLLRLEALPVVPVRVGDNSAVARVRVTLQVTVRAGVRVTVRVGVRRGLAGGGEDQCQ